MNTNNNKQCSSLTNEHLEDSSESFAMYCRVVNICRLTFQRCMLLPSLGRIITLLMAAARTSETSVDVYLTTRQYIPEDSELNT